MTGTVVLVVFLPVVELVVFLPVVELVVFTLPTVELVVDVKLTLVEFDEVAFVTFVTLLANAIGALGTWHWHLLVGSTFVEFTLLQSLHVQLVKLEVWLVPTVTLQMQF